MGLRFLVIEVPPYTPEGGESKNVRPPLVGDVRVLFTFVDVHGNGEGKGARGA